MWSKIRVDPAELNLDAVLQCGQAFRWRSYKPGTWVLCMHNRVLHVQQTESHLLYKSFGPGNGVGDDELVRDYFNLDVSVNKLYTDWSTRDPKFHTKTAGIRILRQDPWETLCAFICSSNNNIKRISGMVAALATEFGTFVDAVDGVKYFDFPEPKALTKPGTEAKLRELGFGYRAKYITATAEKMLTKEQDYLHKLRTADVGETVVSLQEFAGVGPKVADCVALMSLDKHSIVPVDTHMYKIASRDYKMKVPSGAKAYTAVQQMFSELWGEYAGWAHSVLFTKDLGIDKNGVNVKPELVEEFEEVKKEIGLQELETGNIKKEITEITETKETGVKRKIRTQTTKRVKIEAAS